MVSIAIIEENFDFFKFFIAKNSNEEACFIKDVSYAIKSISVADLSDSYKLEEATTSLASRIEHVWNTNSKHVKITKYSKSWWNKECSHTLNNYRLTRSLENWKIFKNKVKTIKQSFFDNKIQEIANKKRGPWELMNWVNKYKLSAIETIKYNDQQYLNINDLWNALYSTFNTVLNHQIDVDILNKIADNPISPWPTFSIEEFRLTIANCNNSSALGPDKLLWSHLKTILKDDKCLNVIICISANACIELGY